MASPIKILVVGLVRICTVLKERLPVAEILPETVNLSFGTIPIPSLVSAASKIKEGTVKRILGVAAPELSTNTG